MSKNITLKYSEHLCINCLNCIDVCKTSAHNFKIVNDKKIHTHNFEKCTHCLQCTKVCYSMACVTVGEVITIEEMKNIILEEKVYIKDNGGVTFSGGEALLQDEFIFEILKFCKENNINTAIDTAGLIDFNVLEKISKYTDVFLYDIKAYDEQIHINNTSVSNKLILKNLIQLSKIHKKIWIRIPLVKGYCKEDLIKISNFLKPLQLEKIEVLPYHTLGEGKYKTIGMEKNIFEEPTKEELDFAKNLFK